MMGSINIVDTALTPTSQHSNLDDSIYNIKETDEDDQISFTVDYRLEMEKYSATDINESDEITVFNGLDESSFSLYGQSTYINLS